MPLVELAWTNIYQTYAVQLLTQQNLFHDQSTPNFRDSLPSTRYMMLHQKRSVHMKHWHLQNNRHATHIQVVWEIKTEIWLLYFSVSSFILLGCFADKSVSQVSRSSQQTLVTHKKFLSTQLLLVSNKFLLWRAGKRAKQLCRENNLEEWIKI